ncbi:MAG: hypothetical protein HWD82_04770 [Flavobacteriaceae bacterium]|nr:hypothetical protein [Flavobacteriaceae bacterium]
MYKKLLFFTLLLIGVSIQSQNLSTDFRKKIIELKKDTIQIDSIAINPLSFKVINQFGLEVSKNEYQINFTKAILVIDAKKYSKITVEYFRYPEFLTKTYAPFNDKLILQNRTNSSTLYSLTTNKKPSEIKIFNGLETKGFITRGVTSGTNQNAVTNSSLDLEISGKLSENVILRANIFDTNIPIQDNGLSQNLTDFDRIFVEIEHKNWRVKAGDLSLKNRETFFFPFEKQVSGLEVEAKVNDNFKVGASGAIVRGKFALYRFTAVEGNQGPYKVFGSNNEPVFLMIEGAERVYVNGSLLKRGENEDYTINYNLGEITFNTTFPITNDMRIWIEYQYADRNYTRFITYEKAEYTSEKLNIAGYFYSENDAKNQPIQQSLTTDQQEILANAGDDLSKMVAESAFPDTLGENKILYKKVTNNQTEYFEYSENAQEQLFNVSFTNVGVNQGDYILDRVTAVGNIYEYVGTNLGEYSPIIRLVAPTKSQMFVVKSDYNPTEKTVINTEVAVSNRDENLFSSIDDSQNAALAAKVEWQQKLIDKKWKLQTNINHEYANKNFYSEQIWEGVEFNRDWNITTNNATKNFFQSALTLEKNSANFIKYNYGNLSYDNGFKANKHKLLSNFKTGKTTFSTKISLLDNNSPEEITTFFRAIGKVNHQFKNSWIGAKINLETNSRKNVISNQFINTSHKYKDYEMFLGVGDSTKIYAKFGYNFRTNDSIRSNSFTEINNRNTFYVQSNLIKNKRTNLSIFANYRITENAFTDNEKTLNSRVVYNQKFFNNFLNLGTVYETSSGNIARQDFVYIRVEQGLGYYTWIDYNNDGIEDFNEFEIAVFQDQANYLRLPKPNLRFIATQRAKIQQTITLNPRVWADKKGIQKLISKFYNQTYLTVENEQERQGNTFQLNPFDFNENSLISLNYNIRNSLYYNKNLNNHSVIYSYGNSQIKQQLFIGTQENKINLHQLDYAHKFATFWLVNLMGKISVNTLSTENFNDRNFEINAFEIQPKVTFLYNSDNRFSVFYHYKEKENKIQNFEQLNQQKFGVEYFYISKKQNQISANFNYFINDFVGSANSPVAYQMLEGLQAGDNFTWNVIFSQKLNSFLNLNLSYLGRKSENSTAIHTGSIQLRANF